MEEYAVRPAISGIIATCAMSIVLAIARATGLLGTPPPKRITASAWRKMRLSPRRAPGPLFQVAWMGAHLGYGALCGVLYHPVGRLGRAHRHASGLTFGLLVWATSYLGLLPALGLYPRADHDKDSRTLTMIAGHVVFGVALAESDSRLSRAQKTRDEGWKTDV